MAATNFFINFNKRIYNNRVGVNILNSARMYQVGVITNTKIYQPYFIIDGERVEDIAEEVYGSTTFFWIILLANNIRNIYEDWPKSSEILHEYIKFKYKDAEYGLTLADSVEYALTNIHHYEDEKGRWINEEDWNGEASTAISYYDYEINENDKKRNINLIRPEYKNQLTRELKFIFR